MDRTVLYPWGEADVQNIAASATIAATVINSMTFLNIGALTANATLNLTVEANVPVGSILQLKFSTTATETLTLGTGVDGPTITGVAGKTVSQGFIFDGVSFKPFGAKIQID